MGSLGTKGLFRFILLFSFSQPFYYRCDLGMWQEYDHWQLKSDLTVLWLPIFTVTTKGSGSRERHWLARLGHNPSWTVHVIKEQVTWHRPRSFAYLWEWRRRRSCFDSPTQNNSECRRCNFPKKESAMVR